VRILLDTNVPAPLSKVLSGGHDVSRTGDLGWQSLENGALLDAAEGDGFDILITCDQNMPRQQYLPGRKLSVVNSVNQPLANP